VFQPTQLTNKVLLTLILILSLLILIEWVESTATSPWGTARTLIFQPNITTRPKKGK